MTHVFFRSIGLREIKTNRDLYMILEDVVNRPEEQAASEDEYGNEFICFSKSMGGDFGITVCGNFVNETEFRMEYYYPYFRGSNVTTSEPIEIERHAAKEAYAGICDEVKLGVTLIFYIENVMDVRRETRLGRGMDNLFVQNAVLAGLSTGGKILLPVMKTNTKLKEKNAEKRQNLMQQAREGDRGAIENLTLDDMDTYTTLSRRVAKEDVLTIVESSFIPYGIESDQYVIIGEILSFYKTSNVITAEGIWIMTLECNDLKFDICVNEKDLVGEPQVGRRFKGRIWMQGHINFG